jgi:hypothetical protein
MDSAVLRYKLDPTWACRTLNVSCAIQNHEKSDSMSANQTTQGENDRCASTSMGCDSFFISSCIDSFYLPDTVSIGNQIQNSVSKSKLKSHSLTADSVTMDEIEVIRDPDPTVEQGRQGSSSGSDRSNSTDNLSNKIDIATVIYWNIKTVVLLVLATIIVFLVGTTHWTTFLLNRHVETFRAEIYQQILTSCVGAKPTTVVGESTSKNVLSNFFRDEISLTIPTQTLPPLSNLLCNRNSMQGQNPGDHQGGHENVQYSIRQQDLSGDSGYYQSTMHDGDSSHKHYDFPQNHATTKPVDSHLSFQEKITFHLTEAFHNISKLKYELFGYSIGGLKAMTISSSPFVSVVLGTLNLVFRFILAFFQVVMQCTIGFPIVLILILWALGAGILFHDGVASPKKPTLRSMNRGSETSQMVSCREKQEQDSDSGNKNDNDNGYNTDDEDASWWHPPSPQRQQCRPPVTVRKFFRAPREHSTITMTRRLSKRQKIAVGRAKARQAWLEGRLGKKSNI